MMATILASTATVLGDVRRDIEYKRAGEESLKADLSLPDGEAPKDGWPVVLIVHGGGWVGGDKTKDIDPLFEPLNQAKIAWVSINYRLAPTHRWPANLDDVKDALKWIDEAAADLKVNKTQIFIAGHSAGGQLAIMAALAGETRLKGVIGLAAVTDMEIDLESRGGLSKGLQALLDRPQLMNEETLQLLRKVQPIRVLPKETQHLPPFLMVQGTADKTVWPKQSENFVVAVKERGGQAELLSIPEGQHRLTEWGKFDSEWTKKITDWIKAKAESPK